MKRQNTDVKIHQPSRRYDNANNVLERSSISQLNKEIIKSFSDKCIADGIKKIRIAKYILILNKIAQSIKKDFNETNKKDWENYLLELESNDKYTDWTKYDYKVTIKKFYKVIKGNNEEYPEEVKWIKATRAIQNKTIPEVLINPDEIKSMANSTTNLRDKAIVLTLYESGARASELLGIKIKHVTFDKYGALILLRGKTGPRKIRLIASVPALANWIEVHPSNDDNNSWLWIGMSNTNQNNRLSYPALNKILSQLGKKIKLQKPVNPHNFRHSRATELAKTLTEAQLCMVMGWKQGSSQVGVYVHLSQRDTDKAILKLHGLLETEEEEPGLMAIKCPRCKQNNTPGARFCRTCGMALDLQASLDAEDKDKQIGISVMETLSNNPELLGRIGELLAQALEEKRNKA